MRRKAFTLVELLVVVAIIALLLGILLAALSEARRHALRVACQSNLRQVALAFISYTEANARYFPRSAAANVGNSPPDEDWVYWQTPSQYWHKRLVDSPIAKYLGKPFTGSVLRCPADTNDHPASYLAPAWGAYPFSYTFNAYIAKQGANRPLRITQIKKSCEVIMLVDESEGTINDGAWFPFGDPCPDYLSIRHDRRGAPDTIVVPDTEFGDRDIDNPDRRGNVAFVDGHVDFVTRRDAHGWLWRPIR